MRKSLLIACIALCSLALSCALVGCSAANQPAQEPSPAEAPAAEAPAAEAPAAEEPETAATGQPAPDFTCSVIDGQGATGEKVSLSDFQGKTVVLTLWASWCRYCVADMPTWQQLYEDLDGQFAIVAINVGDMPEDASAFVAQTDYDFIWCMASNDIALGYPSMGIPYDVVIGPDGTVLSQLEGSMGERMYDTYFDMLSQAINQ